MPDDSQTKIDVRIHQCIRKITHQDTAFAFSSKQHVAGGMASLTLMKKIVSPNILELMEPKVYDGSKH